MSLKVGCISYATSQGISHLAKNFYDAGVITDVMVYRHGSRPSHLEWYRKDSEPNYPVELIQRPFSGPVVEDFIRSVDVMLFFETPFDWDVIKLIRKLGKRSVIVPMYECTPKRYTPIVKDHDVSSMPDKWICPSLLDVEYFTGSPYLPIPLAPDVPAWQLRTRAENFLHNGGNLGLRGHKGTREIMQAMRYVVSPIKLTIRAQDERGLHELITAEPSVKRDDRVTLQYGEIPYAELFDGHDVFLMAEKYNGLSLPLAEARAAGMMVMTSNRFPMHCWLPTLPLIPVARYQRASIGGSYNDYDEAVVDPVAIASKIDEVYGRSIKNYSQSAIQWRESMSWEKLKPEWIKELSSW